MIEDLPVYYSVTKEISKIFRSKIYHCLYQEFINDCHEEKDKFEDLPVYYSVTKEMIEYRIVEYIIV